MTTSAPAWPPSVDGRHVVRAAAGEDVPVHHVDLVLDADADAAVREVWRRLDTEGRPSLAHHRSPSNRPHTTLGMSRAWVDDDGRAGLGRALGALPLVCRVGAPVVFGRGPFVLAVLVVPSPGLISLHRTVAGLLPPAHEHLEPGAWTPHVTLANRLGVGQVGPALEVLVACSLPARVSFEAARHWDSVVRLDEPLADHPEE
jgi:hypothetical protein